MSTAIAFLSGKGGSGKTTLALSMADLLCRCGLQTLLVDCDVSTNGATYFYESQLSNKSKQHRLFSFNTLICTECTDYYSCEKNILKIGSNLSFAPSISEISGQYLMEENKFNSRSLESNLSEFLNWARSGYDVILFDCQAGYTEILPVLLPLMDVDIFVLEADSISGSAMRSLHLKIGNSLGNARLYQIFNKATPEEFDIYSKIVGTFFINIGTLLFDWKIRQAFSRSQIPDLENTSAKYGWDLCNICKIIFPDEDAQKKLEHFSTRLLYQRFNEERKQIEEELGNLLRPRSFPKTLIQSSSIIALIGIFVSQFSVIFLKETLIDFTSGIILSLSLIGLLAIMLVFMSNVTDTMHENRKERQKYEKKLKDLDKEINKLEHQLQSDTNN